MKRLSTKLIAVALLFLCVAIGCSIFLAKYLYEQLYVESTAQSMIEVGEKLQTKYNGGQVSEQLIAEVEAFNRYSYYEVFAVRDPKELSACVPFDIDHETLIGATERASLINNETVTKIGYEPRFDRQIISVIIPFTDQNRLEGIIYIYYPLAKIAEFVNNEIIVFSFIALIFLAVLSVFIYASIKKLLKPLHHLHEAVDQMSKKNYKARVQIQSNDEVGELSKAFNKMAQAIEQEEEAQRTFLATVSHELRTPISYVKGYSEAIQNGYIKGEPQQETIHLIVREANRMQHLTNDLLQLAREGKQEKLSLEPIVLSELIYETAHLLKAKAEGKNISLKCNLDEAIIVMGNEERLKQVLINVVENAVTYSFEGQSIEIETTELQKFARIIVKDKGIGIPKKDLPHITERFYRVNKARSRSDGGSGLGLSIVAQIIAQHDGELTIESENQKGTTVIIKLPLLEE